MELMNNCYFCRSQIYKHNLCKEHFRELCKDIIDLKRKKETINKNEIKNHFHNLRYSEIKCSDYDFFTHMSLKLYAIAFLYKKSFDNVELIDKFKMFLAKYNLSKKEFQESTEKYYDKYINQEISDIDFRNKWPKNYICEDGHCVRSLSELVIDNWLFRNGYLHVYEKAVKFDNDSKTFVICDFYIPKLDVYIEYWGKYDEKYLARKHAKRKLYKENNIKLIELDYEKIKRIDEFMKSEIKKIGE